MRRRKRSYGSGQLVPPRTPGGAWAIRWREGTQRRFRGGFATRELAERVLAKHSGDLAAGRAGLPPDPKAAPTLGVLVEAFLDRRDLTHRAAADDRYRWNKHLAPVFGHLRPAEVDPALIRRFVDQKLAEKLASGTVRIFVALLSVFYGELVEQGVTLVNPARSLPRSTRRLIKPSYDPRTTPFIERIEDVRRIYADLPEPLNVAYAIGALAGLRTGEVLGLKWEHIDLATRRIHIRESVTGQLKDNESRIAPILDSLHPVLAAWKLKTGATTGLVVPPLRRDGNTVWRRTPSNYLRKTLATLGLTRPGLGWYEATRHTFASHWVLNGGSIEKLSKVLGHYSVIVTERYTHLRPDLFAAKDLATISIDLETRPVAPIALVKPAHWADFGQRRPKVAAQAHRHTRKTPEQPRKPRTPDDDDE